MKDTIEICPDSTESWRRWLIENHKSSRAVWLKYNKKASGLPSLSWSDAVDQALCFGWIDGRKQSIDENSYRQYFCHRKKGSPWSKINKEKVERLKETGLLTEAGILCVDRAVEDGSWSVLDDAEALIIPADLQAEFDSVPGAAEAFEKLSPSLKKNGLGRIALAKKPDTRAARIKRLAADLVK